MEVSIENTSDLERKVKVQIPEDQISSKVLSRLQSLSQTTKVQGFRPGKVPMKVIQGRFGTQVRQEIVGQLVQSTFQEAVIKEDLRPVGMPTIDPLEDTTGEGLKYTATFEVFPEVRINPIEDLSVERPICNVQEDDIENLTNVLRKQQSEQHVVERATKDGDVLITDFEGKVNGEIFDGGTAKDFQIEIGKNQLITGFEEGLIGAKAGETKILALKFPDDYHSENLAGKDVEFSVSVKEVKESVLPELNDDFFKIYGVDEGGIEAFKDTLKNNMTRELEQKVKELVRDNILDVLYEANTILLPKVMVENEAQRLLQEMKENLKKQGISAEALDKTEASTYEEQAKKRVTLQLLLSELIKKNEMKADPAKVRQMIESQSQGYEDPSAIINWYYADKERLANVEAMVLEEDIVSMILEKAKVSETEMTFDEIMNKRQTA